MSTELPQVFAVDGVRELRSIGKSNADTRTVSRLAADKSSAVISGLPVIRAQFHAASVQQLWWATFARHRLFGKVVSSLRFDHPVISKLIWPESKVQEPPHSLVQMVAVSPVLA
jgi:tetrahydromethanopterin S-methyltransferase subunit E